MEIREFIGVFVGGIVTLALVAVAVNSKSTTASIAQAFTDGFANDIRAATFQSNPTSSGG